MCSIGERVLGVGMKDEDVNKGLAMEGNYKVRSKIFIRYGPPSEGESIVLPTVSC